MMHSQYSKLCRLYYIYFCVLIHVFRVTLHRIGVQGNFAAIRHDGLIMNVVWHKTNAEVMT